MRNDIIHRVLSVIRYTTSDKRRLKELEEETGIPDRNWKQVWSGKQRPTAHMIEALCRRWPQYAFWVATGITDEANGHTAPPRAWTCNQLTAGKDAEEAARRYFELKMYAQDILYGPSGAASENYVPKRNPTEEELEIARQSMKADNPEHQEILDAIFGKDVQVWKKKHTDLDEAIAQLAFERRLNAFSQQYSEVEIDEVNAKLRTQITAIQSERARITAQEIKKN